MVAVSLIERVFPHVLQDGARWIEPTQEPCMSIKAALLTSLCGLAFGLSSSAWAQSIVSADATGTPYTVTQTVSGPVTALEAPTLTLSPTGTVAGNMVISPGAVGNLVNARASNVTYVQTDKAVVVGSITPAAGSGLAALAITNQSGQVTLSAQAIGNQVAATGDQDQVTVNQSLVGATSRVNSNVMITGSNNAMTAKSSAFGNSFTSTSGAGTVAVIQSVDATSQVRVVDDTSFSSGRGTVSVQSTAYGNSAALATLATAVSGAGTTVNQTLIQTSAGTVNSTHSGTLTSLGGAVTLAPVAIGNSVTTTVK
jgi:hypothetical protein